MSTVSSAGILPRTINCFAASAKMADESALDDHRDPISLDNFNAKHRFTSPGRP
jgi:hypothetical protein